MMWKSLTEEVGPLRERISHTEIIWIGRVLPCNILKCVGRIASISLSKRQSLLFKKSDYYGAKLADLSGQKQVISLLASF
jgi:hypothetical protein